VIVACVVAVAENGVIGRDGGLPWRLPADLAYFKRLTEGHWMIMGRLTFESIGSRPLPGRPCVVVSGQADYQPDGVVVRPSVVAALEYCSEQLSDDDTVFVAGGSRVFAEALPLADRVYLTLVHASPEGDTSFPLEALDGWRLSDDKRRESDEKNPYALSFRVYDRP